MEVSIAIYRKWHFYRKVVSGRWRYVINLLKIGIVLYRYIQKAISHCKNNGRMSMAGGHKNGKSVKKYGVNTLIVRRWWTNMQLMYI